MQDPFPFPPPALIHTWRRTSDILSLSTLPLHVHEILLAWGFYHIIHTVVAPIFSRLLFPKTYPQLPIKTKIIWNVRFVSTVQAILVSSCALWVIVTDNERKHMDWRGRIWGYTGAMGMVQAFAAGYFLWDLGVSAKYVKVLGPGGLAHAVSALLVTTLGFHPFANYYGLNFVLYALSTPFLNVHWYLDKLNMTGSKFQLYNGIILLVTFFSCRVLWGNYQTVFIYRDIWQALQAKSVDLIHTNDPVFLYRKNPDLYFADSTSMSVPTWLAWLYIGSNTVLNFLNVFWFWKMVATVRKRFQPKEETNKKRN